MGDTLIALVIATGFAFLIWMLDDRLTTLIRAIREQRKPGAHQ